MSQTGTAIFTWTATNTKAQNVKDASVINGYWEKVQGFDRSVRSYTISGIHVNLGTCQVLASGGVYLQFADKLQTADLSYSSYSSYATHANVGAYCKLDIKEWITDAWSYGTVVRMIPRAIDSAQAETNVIKIAAKFTFTVYIDYIYDYDEYSIFEISGNSTVRAGETYQAAITGGSDKQYLSYVINMHLQKNSATVETLTQNVAVNGSSFSFAVPASWADYYTETSDAGYVIQLVGYAYDSRTIFDGQTVSDHGFGFSQLSPTYVTQQMRTLHFYTNVTFYKPTLDTFTSEWITMLPSWPSGVEHVNIKDYTGRRFTLACTTYGGANLDRYFLHLYTVTGTGGSASHLAAQLDLINSGQTGDLSPYTSYGVVQVGNGTYDFDSIPLSGDLIFAAYVKDTRGMYSDASCIPLTYTTYTLPSVSVNAFRSDVNGAVQDEGEYITFTTTTSWDTVPIEGVPWNSATMQVTNKISGAADSQATVVTNNLLRSTSTSDGVATSTGSVTSSSTYPIANAYEAKFVYSDYIVTITRTVRITSTKYTIHFKEGGTGIGFGKACSNENSIEINPNWVIRIQEQPLITYSDRAPTGNLVQGMIWLEPIISGE